MVNSCGVPAVMVTPALPVPVPVIVVTGQGDEKVAVEVMRQLRERRPVPVILLTAKGSTADKAKGLDLGADDYVAKPFHPDELGARIRSVIRRSSGLAVSRGTIAFDDVEIDLERRRVLVNGEEIRLSRTESAHRAH